MLRPPHVRWKMTQTSEMRSARKRLRPVDAARPRKITLVLDFSKETVATKNQLTENSYEPVL